MNLSRRRAAASFLSLIALPGAAQAQAYPSKPIRIVVPAGPGGITDIVGRLAGQRLSERLGQPVMIDNKAGASGIIGTEIVARAAPDGYTVRGWQQMIPGSEFMVVPGDSYHVAATHPDFCVQAMLDFIDRRVR